MLRRGFLLASVVCLLVLFVAVPTGRDATRAEFPGIPGIFVYTDGESLWVVDPADPLNPVEIVMGSGASGTRNPHWSPNGRQIVFVRDVAGVPGIFIVDGDGSDEYILSGGDYPDWTPDGQSIVFVDAEGDIATVRLDHSDYRQLTDSPTNDTYPALSPDGSQLAFVRSVQGGQEIMVLALDGTEPVNVTQHPAEYAFIDWLPDSSGFVFSGQRDDFPSHRIFRMDADGSDLVALSAGGSPAVSPDGTRYSYERFSDLNHASVVDGSDETKIADLPNDSPFADWQRIPGPFDEAAYLPGGARE